MVSGKTDFSWYRLERHGRVFDNKATKRTFEYQPWNGRHVFTIIDRGGRRFHQVLRKIADST